MGEPVNLPVTSPSSDLSAASGPPSGLFDPASGAVGVVVPVFGAQPGVGTSGVALALADAAAAAGMRVLLVDEADPARSGLTGAAVQRVASDPPGQTGLRVTTSHRRGVVIRSLVAPSRRATPWELPTLARWVPARLRDDGFDVTVVDVGWDMWQVLPDLDDDQLDDGPLVWLRAQPASPVLVCRASRPSVRQAATVAATWTAHRDAGRVGGTRLQLAVSGADSWPEADLTAGADTAVAKLAGSAVFFPYDLSAALDGWTERPLHPAALTAAGRVLSRASAQLAETLPAERPAQRRTRLFRPPTHERTLA